MAMPHPSPIGTPSTEEGFGRCLPRPPSGGGPRGIDAEGTSTYPGRMCRSIRRLRTSEGPSSDEEIREAALQFVRKVSGFRQPSGRNAEAFESAVDDVAEASRRLL